MEALAESAVARVAKSSLVPLLFALPVAYVVWRGGRDAIFNLFAADAYYYLAIAKNTPLGSLATFDGVSPTNGFHPLWQYFLVVVHAGVGTSDDALLWATFAASFTAATAALCLLSSVIRERHESIWPAAFLVPGVFHLLAPEASLYSLAAWRAVNGMETAFSLLFISLIVYRLARIDAAAHGSSWRARDYLELGCLSALAILSRLDNLALVLAMPLYLVRSDRRRTHAIALLAPPLAAFAAYVAWNVAVGLPPLPVSGTTKSTFMLWRNARVVAEALLEPLGASIGVRAAAGWMLRAKFLGLLSIGCALCLVIAVASARLSLPNIANVRLFSAELWAKAKLTTAPRAALWLPIVILFAVRLAYYVAFVELSHQGFWYYTDAAVVITAVLVLSVRISRSIALAVVGSIVWIATAGPAIRDFVRFTEERRWCPHILREESEHLDRCLEFGARKKIIDFSDGLFAYFLNVEAQPGLGLTANAVGHRMHAAMGLEAYQALMIAKGYKVGTWAQTCQSGRLPRQFATRVIRCGQSRRVHLVELALPAAKPRVARKRP